MSFRIHRRDTEVHFMTKLGENRTLRSCQDVTWFTKQTKNLGSTGLVPAPIFAKMGRSRPKFPERCHPLTCPSILNLVRISGVLPYLFPETLIFRPKKSIQYRLSAYNKKLITRWVSQTLLQNSNSHLYHIMWVKENKAALFQSMTFN